jgi:hypothetical protein
MSGYTPYYSGGWQSGESGGTPITPAALNNMENGIGGAVAKTGDTMTGVLTCKTPLDLTNPATGSREAFGMTDTHGTKIGFVRADLSSAGRNMMQMAAVRTVNGASVVTSIQCGVNSDGTNFYNVSNPDVFRTAIGAIGSLITNGNLDDVKYPTMGYSNGATVTGYTPNDGRFYGGFVCLANAAGDRCTQILHDVFNNEMYIRAYGGTSWSALKKVTATT